MSIVSGWFNVFGSPDKWVDDWFGKLDNGTWTKDDQYTFDILYGFGGKAYFDYKLDKRDRAQYQKHTGIGYGDTNDPRKWPGAGNSGNMLRMVSDNVKRLYR